MPSYLLYLLLILLLWFGAALSRPKMQRITINHHVWEVPNEPGWDEVVKDVELVQQSLSQCVSVVECHKIINKLRAIFYSHPVSRKYLETHSNSAKNILASIFKWG
ncbi:unnamed protein product [Adineta ricciae]|uniref:Uncharacterized protein n=1 Tax=Adineta ricciae TaxID=249248 RepID=A0A814P6T2_ADIRI|nr:unnamed protein product [Adineta ricciae]